MHGAALRAILITGGGGGKAQDHGDIIQAQMTYSDSSIFLQLVVEFVSYLHIFHTWCFQICSRLLLFRHNRRTHSENP